jgi:hypothetical protein
MRGAPIAAPRIMAEDKKKSPSTPARHFKHRGIDRIGGCPFDADAAFQEYCYRIVHANLDDSGNFAPTALLFPGRFDNRDEACQCDSWSLSMFEKRTQLKVHILRMEKKSRNWRKLVGDHGVQLAATVSHGLRTRSVKTGHFSFFEYADFDPKSVVKEHFPLFP